MSARARVLPVVAFVALLSAACSDSMTNPAVSSGRAFLSGGTSGGGSGSGGGGGGTAIIPQVAGNWTGHEQYDPSLSAFFYDPSFMTVAMSFTVVEDAAGNITGTDNIMHQLISGKASTNGTILIQDGTYYGTKATMNITGSVVCSDGSAGTVMSGKFQRKEGFGTISLDNCPVI